VSDAETVVVDSPTPVTTATTEPATPTAEPATATPESTPDPFASNRVSCTREVVADRERHLEVLNDIVERYESAIYAIEGVNGIGAGPVRISGEKTGDHGIIVLVPSQFPRELPDPRDAIPTTIEGCIVNVQIADFVDLKQR
jgi:hypothetical protein